jgi:hypothetical protein
VDPPAYQAGQGDRRPANHDPEAQASPNERSTTSFRWLKSLVKLPFYLLYYILLIPSLLTFAILMWIPWTLIKSCRPHLRDPQTDRILQYRSGTKAHAQFDPATFDKRDDGTRKKRREEYLDRSILALPGRGPEV